MPTADDLVRLPPAITDGNDWNALSPAQQRNFVARLSYCREFAVDFLKEEGQGRSDFDLFDDLELDALINLSISSDSDQVSPWLIHSSWTFDCTDEAMFDLLDSGVVEFVLGDTGRVRRDRLGARCLCREGSEAIVATIARLESSTSHTEAMAQMIALDVVLAKVVEIVGLYRLTISGRRPR